MTTKKEDPLELTPETLALMETEFALPVEVKERIGKTKQEKLDAAAAGQLPLWPDLARAIPNHLARSPLFAPIRRGARKVHDRQLLPSREDVTISYTGKQLDMADQDVFLQILHLFRGKKIPEEGLSIPRTDILMKIGKGNRSIGKADYLWLNEVMHRLKTGVISVTAKNSSKATELSLIDEWSRDELTNKYIIRIAPKIQALFDNHEYAYINWPHRFALEKKIDLAKWLQTYISAQGKGSQTHRFDTIKSLCGAATRLNDFAKDVVEAFTELERVGEIVKLVHSKASVTFIRK